MKLYYRKVIIPLENLKIPITPSIFYLATHQKSHLYAYKKCNLITCSPQITRISDTLQIRTNLTLSCCNATLSAWLTESNMSKDDCDRYEEGRLIIVN